MKLTQTAQNFAVLIWEMVVEGSLLLFKLKGGMFDETWTFDCKNEPICMNSLATNHMILNNIVMINLSIYRERSVCLTFPDGLVHTAIANTNQSKSRSIES